MDKLSSVILCLTVYLLFSEGNAVDPCDNYEEFNPSLLGSRNERCSKPANLGDRLCDYRLQTNWYLIPHDGFLINKCPVFGNCGTDFPVWLNGTLPTESDGIVERTCCIKKLDDCCSDNITIQVRNCSSMIVYYLPTLQYCDSVYCMDTNLPCVETTTTSTTPSTTSSSPTSIFSTTSRTVQTSSDRVHIGMCIGGAVLFAAVVAGYLICQHIICKKPHQSKVNITEKDTSARKAYTPPPKYEE